MIPSVLRRKLGIKRGTVFAVSARKDMIVLKKLETGIKPENLRTLKLKVAENPDFEKPLRYSLKGEWSVRVKPYRLKVEDDKLILLRSEHRKEVYEDDSV